jgi:ATP-dependent Clp protease protease subunit
MRQVKGLESIFTEDLLKKRILFVEGFIDDELVEKISKLIIWLNSQNTNEITLYINSDGGNIQAGFSLYDIIRFSEAPITGIVLKRASSMMIAAFQGCKVRKALEHSVFAFHNLIFRKEITCSNETDVKLATEELKIAQGDYNQIIGARIIGGAEKVKELCEKKMVLTAQEAKSVGLIDEIITMKR